MVLQFRGVAEELWGGIGAFKKEELRHTDFGARLGRSCCAHGEWDNLFEGMEWDARPTLVGKGLWRRHETLVTRAMRTRRYHLVQTEAAAQATQSRHVKPSGTDAAKISRHKRRTVESLLCQATCSLQHALCH